MKKKLVSLVLVSALAAVSALTFSDVLPANPEVEMISK